MEVPRILELGGMGNDFLVSCMVGNRISFVLISFRVWALLEVHKEAGQPQILAIGFLQPAIVVARANGFHREGAGANPAIMVVPNINPKEGQVWG